MVSFKFISIFEAMKLKTQHTWWWNKLRNQS